MTVNPKSFYESRAWLELRYRTLRRYGWTCMSCGVSRGHGVVIQVDHIIPIYSRPDLALDPENLQTACRPCNLGKSNKFADDLRPKLEPVPKKPARTLPPDMVIARAYAKTAQTIKEQLIEAEKQNDSEAIIRFMGAYLDVQRALKRLNDPTIPARPKPQSVVAALLKDMPKDQP